MRGILNGNIVSATGNSKQSNVYTDCTPSLLLFTL